MGEADALESLADGFRFGAYRALPADALRGGLVLIQEIFGVTDAIRKMADGFAEDGYETLAPSLYDRRQPGFEAGYAAKDVEAGKRLSEETPWDEVTGDLTAAIAALSPPVFVAGFCWGGTAAWLAACRCHGVAAASSYYGRRIPELIAERPRCPIILHFGKRDPSIPMALVETIGASHPDIAIYAYEAGHGFASDRANDFEPDAARLARLRTLALFAVNGGGRGEL